MHGTGVILAAALFLALAIVVIIPAGSVSFHGGNLTCAFAVVQIKNGTFEPDSVSVFRNATVVWTNPGQGEHSISVGGDISPPIMPGQSFTKNFHEFGTYDCYCRYHPSERGIVIVR
ncbi:MAG: cupredoxin domain-containing protein [Methanocella sp.]